MSGRFPVLIALFVFVAPSAADILTGVAKVDVTPEHPVVLAGYGSRTGEHEGIDTSLWARALVIGDQQPVAIVVLDNCGVPLTLKQRVATQVAKYGITSDRLVVAATHTHNAPSLPGYAGVLWAGRLNAQQERHVDDYAEFVVKKMADAVVKALSNRERMSLEWAQGRLGFGGNRRVLRDGKWAGFGWQRNRPVDHSLPVLAARDKSGKVRAVWANYACHCTTVGARNRIGGDWAGFANEAMEKEFPDAIAMTSIGCGADVGPQPSGNLEIAKDHGKKLAVEVARVLSQPTQPLVESPKVSTRNIKLPLEQPADRSHWEQELERGGFQEQLARSMLNKLDRDGKIPDDVDYPISVWAFGDKLAMVFLAGEVVVDYSVRLNQQLDWTRLWITAWANDMPGYIPSRRVLIEGGYEAEFSQVYYDLPGRYKVDVENLLVSSVTDLVGPSFSARDDQDPSPFHQPPSMEKQAFARVAEWVAKEKPREQSELLTWLRENVSPALPAIREPSEKNIPQGGEATDWNNFAGDSVPRVFIRQESDEASLSWDTRVVADKSKSLTLCFSGGLGWISEPEMGGFELVVGDRRLQFDVSLEPTRWQSQDMSFELVYLPTWTSNVDSGGFFFVHVDEASSTAAEPLRFKVRSLGTGSKRWFAIDTVQDITKHLKPLRSALGD